MRNLVDMNKLGDGCVADVPPHAGVCVVRVAALVPGTWTNGELAVTGQLSPGGPFVSLPTPVLIAASQDGDSVGPIGIMGCCAVRVEPTTIETSGGSRTPVYVTAEVTFHPASVNVTV